jgi:hypothetical protein
MILINHAGIPFERPVRESFASAVEYVRALYAYNDRVTDAANRAFDESFRKVVDNLDPRI